MTEPLISSQDICTNWVGHDSLEFFHLGERDLRNLGNFTLEIYHEVSSLSVTASKEVPAFSYYYCGIN